MDGSQAQIHNGVKESKGTPAIEDDEEDIQDTCFLFAWRKVLRDKLQQHRYILYCCMVCLLIVLLLSVFIAYLLG